jgi:hypothetical protein
MVRLPVLAEEGTDGNRPAYGSGLAEGTGLGANLFL